jgi:hypothetical protein
MFVLSPILSLFLFRLIKVHVNIATLLPRRGRNKPGSDGEDQERGVAGEAGTYGCLAVDNLYNVMHDADRIYHPSSTFASQS